MEFDDFVIQFSTMVLLACAAFFGVVAVAWYVNKVLEARGKRQQEEAQAKLDSLVGMSFKVAVPPEPTVDERLKALEKAKAESEGSFKWLNDHGLERREFEKRSKECLVEHRELIECTAERVTKLEKDTVGYQGAVDRFFKDHAVKLEKLHEGLVSHARDIDRLDGRIDTLAKRRAPKKRAR